jgi:hypothetical protein
MMIGFQIGDYHILFINGTSIYREVVQEEYAIASILLSAL